MNGVIKKILEDHFEEFKNKNKVLKCKDVKYGHTLYECSNCHEEM